MKKTLVILACALAANGVFAQASAPASASSSTSPAAKRDARVENRIAYLHKQMQITSAQESQWQPFADVMRENAKTMSQLEEQRAKDVQSESALDNMRDYSQLTQAHADGIKRLLSAFEPLYNSFPPEQKQLADATFRGRLGEHQQHKPGEKS
jgi:Spy/CpxP family protein refolding chaperone